LQEIPQVADSVSVMREGRLIGTIPVEESSPEVIASMMIGDTWNKSYSHSSERRQEKPILSVKHLKIKHYLEDVSFDLHGGEVLGIAGLLGSGRTELLHAIFGLQPYESGTIEVDGVPVRKPSPALMREKGIGLTPEDRKLKGLVLPLSVEDNLVLSSMNRISTRQVISPKKRRSLAQAVRESLAIKTASLATPVEQLSGGNQQKVVIGKWLNAQVRVLMLDEPTRGIDIQAKDQVYTLVRRLASEGVGVIFVSSELEEVIEVADRILILNRGRFRAEIPGADANLEHVLTLAMRRD
jgi:simple sugar transport system ATP-binding protein